MSTWQGTQDLKWLSRNLQGNEYTMVQNMVLLEIPIDSVDPKDDVAIIQATEKIIKKLQQKKQMIATTRITTYEDEMLQLPPPLLHNYKSVIVKKNLNKGFNTHHACFYDRQASLGTFNEATFKYIQTAKSNYDAASNSNHSNRSGNKRKPKSIKSKKSNRRNNDDINPGPKPVKLDLPPRNSPNENEENMRKYLKRKKE